MSKNIQNNILKHISDDASTVLVKTVGTTIPKDLKTAQELFEFLGDYAFKTPGLPVSKPDGPGVIAISNEDDTMAGVDNTKAITPYLLKYRLDRPEATTTVLGVTRYATNAEAVLGKATNRTITASALKHVWDTTKSTEAVQGVAKVATLDMAKMGTDDTSIMTPKKVAHAISILSPSEGTATEKAKGVVILATVAQNQTGTARDGVAISPFTFVNSRATSTKVGTTKLSTTALFRAGVDDTVAVTPKTLHDSKASDTVFGIAKISLTKTTNANTALSANANVVYSTGGDTTGRITLNGKKYITEDELGSGGVDVGMIIFSAIVPGAGSDYFLCDGSAKNKNTEKALFTAIGYTFGGSGDWFNVPDLRGLFVRGAGKGNHIQGGLGGGGVGGASVGAVQGQQTRKHKHISPFAENRDSDAKFGRVNRYGVSGVSARQDWDNYQLYTNDATTWYNNPNPDGSIGEETRPWNMSLHYVIKAR